MKTKPHVFKTFPEFSKLTLADREKYEGLIADYPPVSEISFPTLITWWESFGDYAISQLGRNLVISYWIPGVEEHTGLSVVGIDGVDESVATVLDWLKTKGEPPRLVHVPEFTVSSMRFPELYTFTGERDFDECIVPVTRLCALEGVIHHKRWKIRRFLTEVDEDRVVLEGLDLSNESNQKTLINIIDSWRHPGTFNDIGEHERRAAKESIKHAEALGIDNVSLYIDGQLHAFLLYHKTQNSRYVTIKSGRFSYAMPHIFEFCVFKFAQWFAQEGIKYANIELDFGSPALRTAKLALGPTNFFRKYTIKPIP